MSGHPRDGAAAADVDEVDRAVLARLLVDGRAGASDLAEAAGLAASTATKRLARLEDDGIVEEYRPEVDYRAFGYEVTAVFRLDVAGDGLAAVVADLQSADRMVDVYEVTGETDVVAVGKFRNTDEMNARIKALLTDDHVRSVGTDVVLDTVCEYDLPPVPPVPPE